MPEFRWRPVETKDGLEVPHFDFPDCSFYSRWLCARGCRESFDGTEHVKACYKIYVYHRKDPLGATTVGQYNKCIEYLTNGEVKHWKGSVLAFGRQQLAPEACKDIDTTSLNSVADSIRHSVRFKDSSTIRGVRINCDGHMKKHKLPQFQPGTIDVDNIGRHTHTNTIYWEKDLPKLVLGQGLEITGLYTAENLDARNPMASLLSIPCATKADAWGYYRRHKWGNCLITRTDGKPLEVSYLRAFCRWIDQDLRGRFSAVRTKTSRGRKNPKYGENEIEGARNNVIDKISLQRFLDFSKGLVRIDAISERMPNHLEEVDDEDGN
ncbi:hypothetical protein KCU71_g13167, partial [Aureobasidium melanogenum]